MPVVVSHVECVKTLHSGKKAICNPALPWELADLQVALEEAEPQMDLDMA